MSSILVLQRLVYGKLSICMAASELSENQMRASVAIASILICLGDTRMSFFPSQSSLCN